MTQRVLIVEDESKIACLLHDYLAADGFEPVCVDRGDAAVAWLGEHNAQIMLLDLNLPGLPGLEVCKQVRRHSNIPIIMLSARADELDRLLGLGLGADDYVCKPFSPREVVARVRTVLRRANQAQSPEAQQGLQLDDSFHSVTIDGLSARLTAIEYNLLKLLASRPGRLFSRQQLIDSMYPDSRVVTERTVDSHIRKIRHKLMTVAPHRELIHSVYGVGYRYEWQVTDA
ncbi:response regulator [Uliginosibacterium sp. sgz301328]|uniref:response regulator n=1 Tax=Uliginosibacterium sp. sgz301328 TaxID=3243764 RepID=UPI00359E18D8